MDKQNPFSKLGNHLKYVREQSNQTLAEVSGAVEIDEDYLQKIEAGLERPDEDILLLLINYFNVKDREAVQLWELARYDTDMPDDIKGYSETMQLSSKPVVMILGIDVRTMYSDGLEVQVNNAGVTLSFTQLTEGNQATPVAKVGMSPQQAALVIDTMQKALLHAKYNDVKLLPPPSQ